MLFRERVHRLTVYTLFEDTSTREAYEDKRCNNEAFTDAISKLLGTVRAIDFNRARPQAIKNAVEAAFANTGAREGDILTDEQLGQLIRGIVDGMMPFITHNMTLSSHLADVIHQDKGGGFVQS